MKGISYRTCFTLKCHTHRSITVWEADGAIPFEVASVSEFSSPKSFGERECNSNVVWWAMWRKKVIGSLVMPVRERVLRVDECKIFESASFISLLKQSQLQGIRAHLSLCTIIEKHSRQQNGSWRMASSDAPFIHESEVSEVSEPQRIMVLTKDRMTGFWTRNWWIPWQVLSLLREILENSCLRLERRNEEETRAHCLSRCLSSPTAAMTFSMMSCGISIDLIDPAKHHRQIRVGFANIIGHIRQHTAT